MSIPDVHNDLLWDGVVADFGVGTEAGVVGVDLDSAPFYDI